MISPQKAESIYFPVGWDKMTEEERREWARAYAELVLDAVEKEMGGLPPPPSEEEFNRLWNKICLEKGLLSPEDDATDSETT